MFKNRYKSALLVILFLSFASILQAGVLDEIKQKGVLSVGVKADYFPWGGIDENGEHVGFEIDLAQDLAHRLNVELKLVSVTAIFRLQKLAMKEIDVVIATMSGTPERAALAYFIEPPYYSSGVTILLKKNSDIKAWDDLLERKICMLSGAFYNQGLIDKYSIKSENYHTTRDVKSALRDGRCDGWAYDDIILKQLLLDPAWQDYKLLLPPKMEQPWTIAVNREYADSDFASFLKNAVTEWHRSGFLLEREKNWGLPQSPFLVELNALLNAKTPDGSYVCNYAKGVYFNPACLKYRIKTKEKRQNIPAWMISLNEYCNINLSILMDNNNQKLLIKGFLYTVLLSIVAILLAIIIGILFAIIKCARFWFWRITITGLGEFFRLTPPLLHLYIIFFGIGSYISAGFNITVEPMLVAILSFSIYTGAANSGILEAAIQEYRKNNSNDSTARQVIKAVDASYENLQSNLVNLVKLAGVASVISVPEIISSSAKIVAKFGNQMLMMNILLVFYLIFIGIIIQVLKYGKKIMQKWADTV